MNGLLLTLPVALPFTAGLLSYFIRFPSKRAQNLWYGGIICLTTALAWLAILLVGEERVTLLHFTDTLTIALRCDGAARLFAALSATLWPFTALYACDYMRHEKHLAMFWFWQGDFLEVQRTARILVAESLPGKHLLVLGAGAFGRGALLVQVVGAVVQHPARLLQVAQ